MSKYAFLFIDDGVDYHGTENPAERALLAARLA